MFINFVYQIVNSKTFNKNYNYQKNLIPKLREKVNMSKYNNSYSNQYCYNCCFNIIFIHKFLFFYCLPNPVIVLVKKLKSNHHPDLLSKCLSTITETIDATAAAPGPLAKKPRYPAPPAIPA